MLVPSGSRRPPQVGVVAEGQGRKVLFGGDGVRPNVEATIVGLLRSPSLVLRLFAGMVRAPRGSSRQQSVTPTGGRTGKPVRLS